jgi:hypothetical protein
LCATAVRITPLPTSPYIATKSFYESQRQASGPLDDDDDEDDEEEDDEPPPSQKRSHEAAGYNDLSAKRSKREESLTVAADEELMLWISIDQEGGVEPSSEVAQLLST